MFRCQQCNQVPPIGTSPNQVVLETRPKTYPARVYYTPRGVSIRDPGGTGHETVKVKLLCDSCSITYKIEDLSQKFQMAGITIDAAYLEEMRTNSARRVGD